MARAKWSPGAWCMRMGGSGLLALCFLPGVRGVGQSVSAGQGLPTAQTPSTGRSQPRTGLDAGSAADAPNAPGGSNALKLEHMREDERHKRLESDMAKLVELTNQLKVEVDKATKDELSLDVVRKAAEIEKLAHDVKERMKS